MSARTRLPALLFLLAVLAAASPRADADGRVPIFGEIVDVRVVNLEVVVTRGGERVRGLGAEDFEVEVDGERVEIDFFTEVAGGRATAGGALPAISGLDPGRPVGTYVLVFIDDYFAVLSHRNRILRELAAELETLGPEDRMAIVAFDGRHLEMLSSWTRSLPQLKSALGEAERRAAHGLERRGEQRRFESARRFLRRSPRGGSFSGTGFAGSVHAGTEVEGVGLERAKEVAGQVERVVRAASSTLRGFARPPGRRVMLLLGGGWPLAPETWQRGTLERPTAYQGLAGGRELFRPLIDTANRLGYTLYPLELPGASSDLVDAGDGTDPLERRREQDTELRRDELERDALALLAAETGGRALWGGASFDPLERVIEDTRGYYWLGFTPTWRRDDRAHRVKVEVRGGGLRVRARSGFRDLSRSSEVTMMIESAVLFDVPLAAAGELEVVAGEVEPAGRGQVFLPLRLAIPLDGIASGELELRIAAVDGEGGVAEVPVVPVRLELERPPAAGESAVFETRLRLRRAEQRLLLALYDPLSGTLLSARLEVAP